jgi:hypothetical protein
MNEGQPPRHTPGVPAASPPSGSLRYFVQRGTRCKWRSMALVLLTQDDPE